MNGKNARNVPPHARAELCDQTSIRNRKVFADHIGYRDAGARRTAWSRRPVCPHALLVWHRILVSLFSAGLCASWGLALGVGTELGSELN